jgi:1-acyl-sn-glycerol-3-phosphate acyltransferase
MAGTGRRIVAIALYTAACLLALATALLWVPVAALVDLARRGRGVALRTGGFLTFYLCCEILGLLAAAALWLLRPLRGWDAARWQELHFRLQDWWGATLFRAATVCFGLRVEVEGAREARLGEGPYLLLVRHASSGDTLLASALVGRPYGVRLRYVLKRELLWDPCLDVVGRRLPHAFVDRFSGETLREVERVQAVARDLSPGEGVLIYPEGTRFSEAKRARLLERLAREGDAKLLDYASSLSCVLPPRPGGVLGLLDAAPAADVVVCMHTGFEAATTLARIWRGDLLHRTIRVRFQRIPRGRIPAERDARAQWLRELWQRIDAWVVGRARGLAPRRALLACRRASRPAQAVPREHPVGQVRQAANAGPARRRQQPTEADGRVRPPEHLDPLDDASVRKHPVDARHHLLRVEAVAGGIEARVGDVLEPDPPASPVPRPQETNLARAEGTIAVVEQTDLARAGVRGLPHGVFVSSYPSSATRCSKRSSDPMYSTDPVSRSSLAPEPPSHRRTSSDSPPRSAATARVAWAAGSETMLSASAAASVRSTAASSSSTGSSTPR